MQAYVIRKWGELDQLKLEAIDKPKPRAGEVIIRVKTVALNPIDYITLAGGMGSSVTLPAVIGCDVAGVVDALGEDVNDFAVGDEVMGLINFPGVDGTLNGHGYGQFAPAPANQVVKKPAELSFEAAAGLCAVGLTAWQGLMETAEPVSANRRVVIHGAAGGVGHLAVQIAKQAGAYVIATASGASQEFVKELGADEVIDYKTQQFDELLQDIDFVFDTVGGDVLQRSLTVLKPGGTLVTTHWPELDTVKEAAAQKDIQAVAVLVHPDAAQLSMLAKKVADGTLRVAIDTAYPFAELPAALRRLQGGGVHGKLVVKVDGSNE